MNGSSEISKCTGNEFVSSSGTNSFITTEEAATLAYPPNSLRGARNIETFYGTMRVYEWGPAGGEKVLFVHGDATPCLVFSKVAQGLVDSGYRVMLLLGEASQLTRSPLDLWGRGYSDTPLDCTLDVRNGNSSSIVAFSLGGPISLAFAGAFPEAVRSLVLLGPAGLLRKLPEGYEDQLMHHPKLAPSRESIREKRRALTRGQSSSGSSTTIKATFTRSRIPVRYGPLLGREDLWGKVCDIVAGRTRPDSGLHKSKLLVFFGRDDGVVAGEETTEDILKLLPPRHGFLYPTTRRLPRRFFQFGVPSFLQ
ncbi:Alpha/Beta hydrolase protein [Xylaria acuta]|nr:Alpha/Beta hydrolase protein [Xylaria acuta]